MFEVGCAGIVVADTFCGPLASIPAAGQLLAVDEMLSTVGGCAANVASALGRQNVKAGVVGCVGDDHGAKIIFGELESRGVDFTQLKMTGDYPTSQTVVLVVEGEDRRFIHVFGANRAFSVDQIDRDWVATLKALYIGGLFLMPSFNCEPLADLFSFCRKRGVVTILDVVVPQDMLEFPGLQLCLAETDYFMPNDDESAVMTGKTDPVQQARCFQKMGVGTTIITLGEKGAIALQGNHLWRSGVYGISAVDQSGCGDAFTGGFIAAMLGGADVPQMLRHASAVGASCARAVGCYEGIFTAAEAEAFVGENQIDLEHQTL